mmetsp:Transcript_31266/g.82845  ORF Transcript_31266/g.82845 Transcript_31266/m.82845 type:complete len:278 (+) Transcript_31266:124-957(+)
MAPRTAATRHSPSTRRRQSSSCWSMATRPPMPRRSPPTFRRTRARPSSAAAHGAVCSPWTRATCLTARRSRTQPPPSACCAPWAAEAPPRPSTLRTRACGRRSSYRCRPAARATRSCARRPSNASGCSASAPRRCRRWRAPPAGHRCAGGCRTGRSSREEVCADARGGSCSGFGALRSRFFSKPGRAVSAEREDLLCLCGALRCSRPGRLDVCACVCVCCLSRARAARVCAFGRGQRRGRAAGPIRVGGLVVGRADNVWPRGAGTRPTCRVRVYALR